MKELEAKKLVFLENDMESFAKSGYRDDVALQLIIAALMDVPLYFPVEIDLEAMLGNINPEKLKAGDEFQPQKDVRMRILTFSPENGVETVPMFTSDEEAAKGPSASMVRFYPQDYLPKLIQMDKPVIINPFSESRFLLSKQIITETLWPAVQRETNTNEPVKPAINDEKPVNDEMIGKKIGNRYTILRLLGLGGCSRIYLVMDEKCNKQWAMKVYDKNHGGYSSALRDNGPIAEEIVIRWSQQLCDVLGYLHKQDPPCIYRDMKPANIILQLWGNVKLIVTGYNVLREHDDCAFGMEGYVAMGGYAAPEQYAGESDIRSDIYGLGMTLHCLVTGIDPNKPPYEVRPIRAINPKLSSRLEAIILRCIQLNPNERFQSCDELMAALQGGSIYPPEKKGFMDRLLKKIKTKNPS